MRRKRHRKVKGTESVVCEAPEVVACTGQGVGKSKEVWFDFEREQCCREQLEPYEGSKEKGVISEAELLLNSLILNKENWILGRGGTCSPMRPFFGKEVVELI